MGQGASKPPIRMVLPAPDAGPADVDDDEEDNNIDKVSLKAVSIVLFLFTLYGCKCQKGAILYTLNSF